MLKKKLCILAFVGLFIGLSASASMAAAPANDYNFDGATHYLQCISLNKSSDVATITINSVDSNGVVNGSVKAIYGSYWTGNQRLYGWTVHSHTYQGTYVPHIICRTCN